jgi:hypothetical protein
MQHGLVVLVLAMAMAVGYGVLFSLVYPLVRPDGSLAALFAVLGLLTAFAITGVAKFFRGRLRRELVLGRRLIIPLSFGHNNCLSVLLQLVKFREAASLH